MKRSTNRIVTTHTGSLARPDNLLEMLLAKDAGQPVNIEQLEGETRRAVAMVVRHQVEAAVDVVNDGEQSKISFGGYVNNRLSGFSGTRVPRPPSLDMRDFPEYVARVQGRGRGGAGGGQGTGGCNAPLAWKDFAPVEKDIENLKAAVRGMPPEEVFMSACSPGFIANGHPNQYYPTQEAYLAALADVMKREYEAIVKAGLILQLDAPDLAMRASWNPDLSVHEFRKVVQQHIDAINYATRDIPADQVRVHVCWGASEWPHHHDTQLKEIVDILMKARPAGLSIVGANGRHEHEWKVWKDIKLPAGKVIIPGVVDNTTNIVEHPETVAERVVNYAGALGKENIIAGVDCGFGTQAGRIDVDPKIAWVKLKMLTEGATLASKELWKK